MTSIQKFLGHKRLNSTMIYARVHDRTVAEDYYAAMEVVEKRLEFAFPQVSDDRTPPVDDGQRAHLLGLAVKLAEPELTVDTCLHLVDQMVRVLDHRLLPDERQPPEASDGGQKREPP